MLKIQAALLDITPGEMNVHQQLQQQTLLDHGQPLDAPLQVKFWCLGIH
jgi:hypothetical protein